MLIAQLTRRAGRLLGAVAAAGVLSAGLVSVSTAAAEATTSTGGQHRVSANGIGVNSQFRHHPATVSDANGINV